MATHRFRVVMPSKAEVSTQARDPSARPVPAPETTPTTTPTTETTDSTIPAQAARSTNTPSAPPAPPAPPAPSTTLTRTQRSLQPAPASTPRPIRPAQTSWQVQQLKFPLEYVPAYTGPQNKTASRESPVNGQSGNQNQGNGFNSSATTAMTSKHYASRVAKEEDERRKFYYNILGDMDPYKGTPKEFIHLLVKAAMRDEEISKAIRRLNEERLQNPSSWTPVRPQDPNPSAPQPGSVQNHHYGTHDQQQNQQPNQQFMPGMVPGYGPQQPPLLQQTPHTVVYYVYPPATAGQPHQVIPGPMYGSPPPNMYPPYPQPQVSPGIGVPSQAPQPHATGAPQGQAGSPIQPNPVTPAMSHTHQKPGIPIPPQSNSRQPSTRQRTASGEDGTGVRKKRARHSKSSDNTLTNNVVESDSNTDSNHTAIQIDDTNKDEDEDDGLHDDDGDNVNDGVDINLDEMDSDQGPGRKEQTCNFTWVVDRAETLLGWTGQYKNESEIRQDTIGQSTAIKLQKFLKRMNAMVDKNVTFSNRVHILTVMREVIMATLDTDSRIGIACRQNAKEYDDTFVEAVGKLSPKHKQGLRSLECGKWMGEMQMLVEEANRQSIFPRLAEVSALLET